MKIYHDPSIEDQLDKARAKFNGNMEKILGVGLNQPCEPLNSSSRKIMFSTQSTHRIELLNPEVPLFGTGYEAEFARHSASLIKTECEWTILAKIEKYSKLPGHHYYLIVMNQNGDLDMFERVSYHHQTETYGYLYNTSKMDCLNVGDTIRVHNKIKEGSRERIQMFEGTVIAKHGGGISETFTVRRVSYGVGVEKTFPIHSPNVDKIVVFREAKVRRAKLYYLRNRVGKAAKVKEKVQ